MSINTGCATLRLLHIGGNDIGDVGLEILSEALQHSKSLTKLDTGLCGLSVKGCYGIYVAN